MSSTTVQLKGVETATLSNGLQIVTERMPHVRSVSVGIWIGVGSRRETAPQNGISHFIEHMLFKGTSNRTAEAIARSVDSIGGNLDAFTSRELTSYNTKIMDEHLPIAFDVLSDMVLNPLFREEDLEKEKGVILEEIKMDADSPEYVAHELFCSNFWKDHPIGRPILGTRNTVKSFSRANVVDYYAETYVPSNIVITAAGNLQHEDLVRLVEERFAGLPLIAVPGKGTTPETHARITLKEKKSLEQVHVYLGVPAYPMTDERRYACYALNALLGGGMSSRLFQNIRENLGLAYSIYSELNLYRDTGCMAICAGTSKESAQKVVECVMQEFRTLRENKVPAEELRRAKDHLKGSLMLSLESTSSRMGNLARQQMFYGRFFGLDEMLENIESVTAEDVQQVAQDFFQHERIALTVFGPIDGLTFERSDLVC